MAFYRQAWRTDHFLLNSNATNRAIHNVIPNVILSVIHTSEGDTSAWFVECDLNGSAMVALHTGQVA